MHLVQLIHSKSVQARMMASGQNPQYLEYVLLVHQDSISVKYSFMSPVVILLSRRRQCFPANKNQFIIFYLSLKLTKPEWPHNFIIFQQNLSTNSQIRGRKISSSLTEEFYAQFLLVYLRGGCSTTVLSLTSFSFVSFFQDCRNNSSY